MSVLDDIEEDLRVLFKRYEQRAIVVVFAREVDVDDHLMGRLMTYQNHTHGMAILSDPATMLDIAQRAARCRRASEGGDN